MKKHLSTLFAFLFIVPCLFLLSACNKTQPTSKDWENVALTSETLTLPELKISKIESSNKNNNSKLIITWNNGTETIFNDLANQCYTKIPANINESNKVASSLEELVENNTDVISFNAYYSVNETQYACSILYFINDYNINNVNYKKDQIILSLIKEHRESISHEIWDIESSDKTWFTTEELNILGLNNLTAPQGDVLGKLISNNGSYTAQLSIENTTKEIYLEFIQKLFNEYNVNSDYILKPLDSYNNPFIYSEFDGRINFTPKYKVDNTTYSTMIMYEREHIVIYIREI